MRIFTKRWWLGSKASRGISPRSYGAAAQWAGLAAGYFVRCAPPSSDHIVSAKAAGAIVVAGIATAPFAAGIGIVLIATGAIGGLLAVGITVRRSAADEVIAR